MVSARRATRPIVAIYPRYANFQYIGASAGERPPTAAVRGLSQGECVPSTPVSGGKRKAGTSASRPTKKSAPKIGAEDRLARSPEKPGRKPGKPPKKPQSRPAAAPCSSLKWGGLVGLVLAPGRRRRLHLALPVDRHPRSPTTPSRPRPRSSTTTTARASRAPRSARYAVQDRDGIGYDEMPQTSRTPSSPRRTGASGPTTASTPRASCARCSATPRATPAGCLDDHPAVREDPLPHDRALLHPQGQGGDRRR